MMERRQVLRRAADVEMSTRCQEMGTATMASSQQALQEEAKRQRRHVIRHECKVHIYLVVGYAAGGSDVWTRDSIPVKGKLLDLSQDGASLYTRDLMDTGQNLRLSIYLRDGSEARAMATVRWVKSLPEKNAYASGVQFTQMDQKEKSKLDSFFADLESNAGF